MKFLKKIYKRPFSIKNAISILAMFIALVYFIVNLDELSKKYHNYIALFYFFYHYAIRVTTSFIQNYIANYTGEEKPYKKITDFL